MTYVVVFKNDEGFHTGWVAVRMSGKPEDQGHERGRCPSMQDEHIEVQVSAPASNVRAYRANENFIRNS